MTTLHIDWTRCRGRGGCVELLPELIGRDEWGYPLVATDTEVPVALAAHARRAVRDCPRLALRLEDRAHSHGARGGGSGTGGH